MRSVSATVAAVLAVSSVVLLSGCGSGPSQVGAAAIVGDTEITVAYVQAWWERVLADDGFKERVRAEGQFDELGRLIATEAARHELLKQVAEREGLRYDEAQVSELIEQLGGEQAAVEATQSIYDRDTIRERTRDQLLAVALGRKYFDTTVRYDFTMAGSRDEALAKARELAADPDRAAAIIQADGRSGAPAGLDRQLSIGDNLDGVRSTLLFSVPAGTVIAFPSSEPASQGQWMVAVVRERTAGVRSNQPGATTVDRASESHLEVVGLRLLGVYSREIGVRLNPRYGVWSDPIVGAVPNEGENPAIVVPLARPLDS